MGILIENQIVSRWTFLNVILIGLRLKEFDWAGIFIKQYQQFLEPRYRENFVHYCQARLLYEQKKYKEAQRLLVQVEYDDMLINLNAKSMLLKMFYEEEELDALESLLESMRTYLQRKEVIGYHKANYQNIIRYTKKLLRVTPRNKEQKEKLRQEIQHANPLTEKEWLLEMLEAV
jgi:tetratricopeptide (TPR) repeat protein